MQRRKLSVGIRSAVVHVVAQKVRAAGHFYKRAGADVGACRNSAPQESRFKAAAKFRRNVGKLCRVKSDSVAKAVVASDVVVVALVGDDVVSAWLDFRWPLVPGRVNVAAHHRKHSRRDRAAPAGGRPQGNVKANFLCHCLERLHVALAFFACQAAAMAKLVFYLNADYRAAVL